MSTVVHKKRGTKKGSRLLPRPNLWVVLSVAVLVVGLSVITALGPSSVTGNTVQNIGYMTKGDPLQLAVQDVPGLQTIFTNAAENIKSGKIVVEVDDSIPFDRAYVSKFKVSSEGKFGPLQFTFKIKEQDLLNQGISRNDLRLYNGLREYDLQLLKVNYGYLYYVVTVPSMGNFVLGRIGTPEKEAATKEEAGVETPAVEEQPTEATVEAPQEGPLAGLAAESAPQPEPKGFFAKIAAFFRNLFS